MWFRVIHFFVLNLHFVEPMKYIKLFLILSSYFSNNLVLRKLAVKYDQNTNTNTFGDPTLDIHLKKMGSYYLRMR